MRKHQAIKIFTGNSFSSDKGTISFINDFQFPNVKRFYQITCPNKKIIRAFHGHMKEAKFAYAIHGSLLLCVVPLDNPKNPSKNQKIEKFVLTGEKPQIIYIPPGHANGFRALEKGSKIIFFSNKTVAESEKDDYRYPYDYWGKEVWKA